MKNRRNVNAPPTADLVQYYIDSAYDNVKLVADNLGLLIPLAEAIEAGELDNFLQTTDIDTLVELNTILTDATLTDITDQATAAQGALADTAIQGPFATAGEAIGGVDNTHAMTALRVAQAIETFADTKQNNYAGTVDPSVTDDTNAGYSVGSVWINNTAVPPESFRCADAAVGAAVWLKTTLTSDEMAAVALTGNSDDLIEGVSKLLMTAIERSKLSGIEDNATADQTGAEIKTAYEAEADTNAYTDAEKSKLAGVETGATADQSNAEIATGYNTVTPIVSQVDAEAGISATAERWTPERVAQAIAALGGGGGGGGGLTGVYTEVDYAMAVNELVYANSYSGPLNIPLPVLPSSGDKCSVWDVGDNAHISAIFISGNGEDIELADGSIESDASINMAGGRMDFLYSGGAWHYSYVVQTIQPSTIVTERKYIDIPIGNFGWSSAEDPTYTQLSSTQINGGYPPYLNFPASTNIKCMFATYMPEDWDGVTTTCDVVLTWSPTSTNTGDVLWLGGLTPAVEGDATSHQSGGLSVIDTAIGTANVYQNTLANFANVFAIAGKPAMFMLQRRGADVSDTFTGGVHLHAITISYMASKTLTAAVNNNPNTVSRDMTGVTDTLLASDAGKVIYASNAAAQDLGIPDGLPIGFQFILAWEGVGEPSVSMDGAETIVGDTAPSAQYKRLHVEKRSATVWWGTG